MLKEILDSAKSNLTDRLSSPLLGSFVISWCLWNWKFLVILFSDAGVTRTFELTEAVSFPDSYAALCNGLLYPVLTSLIYVFLYPFPARFAYGFILRQNRKSNQLRQNIAKETLLTVEESHRLTSEFNELYAEKIEIIAKLNEKVTQLTLGAQIKNSKNLKPTNSKNISEIKISESQSSLLNFIHKNLDGEGENKIKEFFGANRLQTEFDIGELIGRGLLRRVTNIRGGGDRLKLTQEGLGILLGK